MISVCSSYSTLSLKNRISFESLPSETKKFSVSLNFSPKFSIFESLPPSLVRTRDLLAHTVNAFARGDAHSGKPAVLCFGHPGTGKAEVFSAVASKVGFPLISYDAGILLGDSSGATEAKLKRVFVQAKDESPAILLLRNVHLLARNRDGDRDERVLNTVAKELEQLVPFGGIDTVQKCVFLIGETDADPHDGSLDERLASLFEHWLIFDCDNAGRRETLDWLVECEAGRSCTDDGEQFFVYFRSFQTNNANCTTN